ncbi:MAG: hypothetical protein LKE40_01465 [Spirochaetia bacterium]|jgi:hypothetical protein|nr:hypothetical protein [Spirochaetia bacterium]
MDENLNEMFKEFKSQVGQIADHAENVNKVNFTCSLKNGTGFSFKYDSEHYHNKDGEQSYRPAGVFNAVLDIISAAIALAFIALFILGKYPSVYHLRDLSFFQAIVFGSTFLDFVALFVTDSIYHLMDKTNPNRKAMFNVSQALKVLTLLVCSLTYASLIKPAAFTIVLFIAFIESALSLLFLSMGTKTAVYLHMIMSAILPFTLLMCSGTLLTVSTSIFLCLSSLLFIVVKEDKVAKTNPIFMSLGFISFSLLLNAIVLA